MYDVFAIHKDLRSGELSFRQIAEKYDISMNELNDILDEMYANEVDCDDSDDGYALASAGFGTDEDYGYDSLDY